MLSSIRQHGLSLLLLFASFAVAVAFHPRLPDEIPAHRNAFGEVERLGAKSWGAFLFPVAGLLVFGLALPMPRAFRHRRAGENWVLFAPGGATITLAFIPGSTLITAFGLLAAGALVVVVCSYAISPRRPA